MPVQGGRYTRGADRQRSAPLCFGALLLAVLWGIPFIASAVPGCLADRIDERVRISFVQDGDTLMLNDGRRLRLIGINTPELGKSSGAAQPGAIGARDRLRQLTFISQQQLSLRFDQERTDQYGRLLAHAFLADGRNLTELLLAEGQGTQLVVPPNSWQANCYREAAQAARQQRIGIWALPVYQPVAVTQLNPRSTGFQIVRGRVSHLSNSAPAIWINLVGNLALRIERTDLDNFRGTDLAGLIGSEIEVQGWIYTREGQLRMPLRHPYALKVIAISPPLAAPSPVE